MTRGDWRVRIVPTQSVDESMVLARTIYVEGRPLLRSGARLKPSFRRRLASLGITAVYVRDPQDRSEPPPEIVSEQTRRQTYEVFAEVTGSGSVPGKIFPTRELREAVNRIIDDVLANRQTTIHLTEIRAMNDYLFSHSLGVCTVALLIGIHRGLNPRDLVILAEGALLHDVGKTLMDEAVWNKESPLTDEEFRRIQQHTVLGYNYLREKGLNALAAHIAYQHHERFDGSGYPRGLRGHDIAEFARIAAVADVYDALTSDRPYRARWDTEKAISLISKQSGIWFDSDVVRTFRMRVAIYPVGCVVELNTGETGKVEHVNEDFPTRPVIHSSAGRIDLQREPSYFIRRVIDVPAS